MFVGVLQVSFHVSCVCVGCVCGWLCQYVFGSAGVSRWGYGILSRKVWQHERNLVHVRITLQTKQSIQNV